jgi:four helix bundle protein
LLKESEEIMAKGDDIEERLIGFAVRIVKLCDQLPRTQAGRHIAGQLLRCGTAPAAHYAEARGAESTNDFVHKLKICLKELNEARIWLKIIARSEMLPESRLVSLAEECDELCRIINASIKITLTKVNH